MILRLAQIVQIQTVIQTTLPNGAQTHQAWSDQNEVVSSVDELGAATSLSYDGQGNMTAIKRPEDTAPTQITWDQSFSKPTRIVPLAGSPTQFTVSSVNGDITRTSRADSNGPLSLTVGFDSFGNPISVDNGLGSYANQTDLNGLLTFVFDSHNPETRTYDNRGRILTRSFRSGRVLDYVWDNFDRVTRVSDSHGPSYSMVYDVVGRLLSRTVTPLGGGTPQLSNYQYDDRDRLISITDSVGRVTLFQYGSSGSGAVIDKPSRVVDPVGRVTRLDYDSMQRLSKRTEPGGSVTSNEYNLRGDMTALVDAEGHRTVFSYDGNRRLVSRARPAVVSGASGPTLAAIELTNYKYDAAGKLVREEHPSLSGDGSVLVTELTYDSLDRVVEKVEKREDARGKVLEVQDDSSFSYGRQLDAQRLASASNGVEHLSFAYEAAPPFANTGYTVHAAQAGNPLGLVEGAFNVTRATTDGIAAVSLGGSELLSMLYDPAGRLTRASSGFAAHGLSIALGYDGFGRRSQLSSSMGLSASYAFDLLNRVTAINFMGFDGHRHQNMSEALAYNQAGDITAVTREFGQFGYGYDVKDQLIQSSFTPSHGHEHGDDDGDRDRHGGDDGNHGLSSSLAHNLLDRSFQYDLVGNRIADNLAGAGNFINNFLVGNAKTAFTPDSDGFGNVASKLDLKSRTLESFSYRVDKKLAAYSRSRFDADDRSRHEDEDDATQNVRYFYDPLGRRAAKVVHLGPNEQEEHGERNERDGDHDRDDHSFTQSFVYLADSSQVLLAKRGDGNLVLYLNGQGMNEHLGSLGPHGVKAYVADHLGSVLNTDVAGRAHTFGSWGEPLAETEYADGGENLAHETSISRKSDPASFGYAGMQLDLESGLYHTPNREFDTTSGRWTTPDPLFPYSGMNPYVAFNNNPLIFTDPYGLATLQIGISINVQIGPISISGGFGVAVDTHGNVGGYVNYGGGGGAGLQSGAGGSIQVSNADTIKGLNGPFFNTSASAGAGLGGTVDTFYGVGENNVLVNGAGFTAGAGAGASLSGTITGTRVIPWGNILPNSNAAPAPATGPAGSNGRCS